MLQHSVFIWRRPGLGMLLAVSLISFRLADADDRRAAELLPATVVLFAELPRPLNSLEELESHPLKARVQELEAYQKAMAGKEYLAAMTGLKLVEAQLGQTWREALEVLAGNGIAVAVDAPTEGLAILIQGSNSEELEALLQKAIQLARQDAKNKDKPEPFAQTTYRDIPVYKVDKGGLARIEDWVIIVNKGALGQQILDRFLDGGDASLASSPRFQEAQKQHGADSDAWGYIDLATLRETGAATKLFTGRTDNPVAELLVGGILETMQQAEFALWNVDLTAESLSIRAQTPWQPEWVSEIREHYFGPRGAGAAPAPRQVPETLFSIAAHRNLSAMWLRAGDLFNEDVNDQFAAADATLATLFSGKDFAEEILGALSPQLQVIGVRQDFSIIHPQPAIKLPAFALIAQLNEPQATRREFRRIFQSLIGFVNVTGATNGQPQLELNFHPVDGGEIISASYLPEKGKERDTQASINYNFSPSIAFAGNMFAICSTENLARALVASAMIPEEHSKHVNTAVRLQAVPLRGILDDNRSQLIAQNMLQEGHSREEAELQIGTLLDLISMWESARLQLTNGEGWLRLSVHLSVAEGN